MEKKLGIEIEFTGVKRVEVVRALENFFNTVAEEVVSETTDDKYKYHRVADMNGETWLVVRDRSIKAEKYMDSDSVEDRFTRVPIENTEYMCELVTPPLTSKSLPLLFSVVDIIRGIGGLTNNSCGIHIHVDKPEELNDCILIYNRFLLEQDSIFEKFKVSENRLNEYCKKLNVDKLLNSESITNSEDLVKCIYKYNITDEVPLKNVRYYGLNMYSLLNHGTIEFRIFNSSLSRADIAVMLDWVLHFMYTSEDYSCYIPILGNSLMNEMKVEG